MRKGVALCGLGVLVLVLVAGCDLFKPSEPPPVTLSPTSGAVSTGR
jgi:hypothetical protein